VLVCIDLEEREPEEISSFADEKLIKQESLDESTLFELASRMVDDGYGTFERCLQILKASKGNVEEAQKALSGIMFSQYKE